ncbi:alpha/beta hydrolase [Novosphingobium sp.]|uniref:alpha/beta hydrolase n=1 Tax=Novosphingobium sp. TaxID=1874826 RepID=UPI0038B7B3CA
MANYAGAEDFFRFITEEVRPAVAAIYKVDLKDQTLYGHSLGGLFTLHVLFNHPDSFRVFVASSPSIWFDDRVVLKDEAAFSQAVMAGKAAPRVLIEVGGLEEGVPKILPPGATESDICKSDARFRMISNACELADRLSRLKGAPGYEVQSHAFDGETHLTVMAASLSRALTFADKR